MTDNKEWEEEWNLEEEHEIRASNLLREEEHYHFMKDLFTEKKKEG